MQHQRLLLPVIIPTQSVWLSLSLSLCSCLCVFLSVSFSLSLPLRFLSLSTVLKLFHWPSLQAVLQTSGPVWAFSLRNN